MSNGYENRKIETLGSLIGVRFLCWSAPEGLPDSVLQPSPTFPLMPKVPLRIRFSASDPSRDDALEVFLKSEFGLTKGVDYERHHNGMRGGIDYYDFPDATMIDRLETYARDRGLKPKEYLKSEPAPSWMKIAKLR